MYIIHVECHFIATATHSEMVVTQIKLQQTCPPVCNNTYMMVWNSQLVMVDNLTSEKLLTLAGYQAVLLSCFDPASTE